MTQSSFDFTPKPNQHAEEIQKWVENHNQQVILQARTSTFPPGSLLSAIDAAEAKTNAVYLLRGVTGQLLRKSMTSGPSSFKEGFIQALRAEMTVKKTSRDPALSIRHTLIKVLPSR